MSQPDELLGELRQHEPWVADHRQQHLADRLGLARIQPLSGRPVARQADVADALEIGSDARRLGARELRELLRREAVQADQGPQHQRVRKLRVVGERPDDFGGLGAVLERVVRRRARGFGSGAHLGDRSEDFRRTELNGFHWRFRGCRRQESVVVCACRH